MATAGGPNIERDGLVFGMDTGYGINTTNISSRFYPGKATTNYLSDGISGYNIVQGTNWLGATPTYTLGTSEFDTPIASYNTSGTSYLYSHDYVLDDDLSTLSSQTVTFSIYLKRDGVDSNVGIRIYDNVSGYTYSTKSVTSEFSRYTMTKTLGANPTRIFVMIDNTGGGVIDFHSPMLEIGDASPFVDGTRSSTQSLIDLTKSTNIDVSNVSFDSTGQPTFDGTDDYINLGNSSLFDFGQNGTIEAVLKPTNSTGNNRIWCIDNNSTNLDAYLNSSGYNVYMHGGVVGTTTPLIQNKYNHLVVVYNVGTISIYINGNAGTMTGTTTGYNISNNSSNNSNLYLGAYRNLGYNLNGETSIFKIYNQPLTAQEVQQNYNAYKNRFNI